jgi:hypothetical protein
MVAPQRHEPVAKNHRRNQSRRRHRKLRHPMMRVTQIRAWLCGADESMLVDLLDDAGARVFQTGWKPAGERGTSGRCGVFL